MITELLLDGFQKHSKELFRFEPGLNVIVGDTDAGKSTIIRALRWFALHEPTSADLIQHGRDSVRVGVGTPNGRISRFKSPTKNGYKHNGEEFLACGTTQPLAVSMAHGLIVENFQAQHDPHFLLALAPGQLAKEINRIVALDDIDTATRWLRSRSIALSTSIADTETELEAAVTTRNGIKLRVDEQERLFLALSDSRERATSLAVKRDGISHLVTGSDSLMAEISKTNKQAAVLEKVIAAKAALDEQEASQNSLKTILQAWRAVESVSTLVACIEAAEALKSKLQESARFDELQERQNTTEKEITVVICTIRDTISKAGAIVDSIQARATKLSDLELVRKRRDLEISTCKFEIEIVEKQIASLPKTICPTCGRETK